MVLPGSKILGATELKKVFRHAIRESSALSGHLYGHCSGSTLLSTAMAFLDHRLFYGIFQSLKELPKISFGALRVRVLSNLFKVGTNTGYVGLPT